MREIKVLHANSLNRKDTLYVDLRLIDTQISYIQYRLVENFLLDVGFEVDIYDPEDEG